MSATSAACGGTVTSYTETNSAAAPRSPKLPSEVEVYLTGAPQRAYTEVGYVESRQETLLSRDSQGVVLKHLRKAAAQRDCDGVIVQSADTVAGAGYGTNGPGSAAVGTLRGYRGVCIVFSNEARSDFPQQVSPPVGALGYTFGRPVAAQRKPAKPPGALSPARERRNDASVCLPLSVSPEARRSPSAATSSASSISMHHSCVRPTGSY